MDLSKRSGTFDNLHHHKEQGKRNQLQNLGEAAVTAENEPTTHETRSSTFRKKRAMNENPAVARTSATESKIAPKKLKISREQSAEDLEGIQEQLSKMPDEPSSNSKTVSLLEDIIILILKRLTNAERENAKLVCRGWYNAYSNYYHPKEKLIFGSEYVKSNLDEILVILSKSTRPCFHLEFYGAVFGGIPRLDFWRTCGSRIISLKLVNCQLSSPFLAGILRYCSSIQSLELCFKDLYDMKYIGIKVPSKIIPSELKNSSLRTMKINFERFENFYSTFWIFVLRGLFDSFPNITNFSFCHLDLHGGKDMGSGSRPSRLIHYFCGNRLDERQGESRARQKLYEYWTRGQIESIALNFLFYPKFLYDSLESVQGLTKITEIAIDWDLENWAPNDSFLKFAQKQVHLKKVTSVTKEDIDEEKLHAFMAGILKIPSIREIQLFLYDNEILWKNDWHILLSTSNVETLGIVCKELKSYTSSSAPLPRCEKLSSFRVGVRIPNTSYIKCLLETFPNLEDLYLSHVDAHTYKSVCTNQIKLQTLTIGKPVDFSRGSTHMIEWSFLGYLSSNYLSQLKNLRKLEVPRSIDLNGCHLNKLESLRINDEYQYINLPDGPDFYTLLLYQYISSSLQAIWVDNLWVQEALLPGSFGDHELRADWCFDVVVDALKNLPHVKIFYVGKVMGNSCQTNYTDVVASSLFDRCPSLRIFGFTRDIFVKDVIKNLVHKSHSVCERELKRRFFDMNEKFDFQYRLFLSSMI